MVLPAEWRIVAVVPEYELETRRARAVLPESVPHRDAVYNVQRAAFLIAQLARGHRDGVREAMRDRLHQPYRAPLVPGLDEILALDCDGLIGVALSGAGPSVVALADECAEEIGGSIEALFAKHGVRSETRVLQADNGGLVRTPIGVVS
jgi:homoserine kinase